MKRYFLLFGSAYFLLAGGGIWAQEPPSGVWSFSFASRGNYTLSSAMHGDINQYEAALAERSTPAQYPFGGAKSVGVGFGGNVEYRFARSPLSLYFGAFGSSFNAGFGFRTSSTGRFTMSIASASVGLEYTFGQTYQRWNFYGRVGVVPSAITTSNRSGNGNRFAPDSLRANSTESRTGLEIEFGQRYRIPRTPIGVEASINYTNVNLIGKSYQTPTYSQSFFGPSQSSINDGKNPNDPNDNPRTIDFLAFRVGIRYYF